MTSRLLVALLIVSAGGPAAAQQVFKSAAGDLKVETVASGLVVPWGLAFLPDGRLLVTERPGRMRIVTTDGKLSPPLGNVPRVFASGQGGMLDVILDRNFAQNRTIYFCYAEPADSGARTTMARATLVADETPRLDNVKPIFRQEGPLSSGHHFGCRIVHMPDDTLFLTMGDHYGPRDQAQNLGNHIGKTCAPTDRCHPIIHL
jgi:glucose/arabinose dehydrogenase